MVYEFLYLNCDKESNSEVSRTEHSRGKSMVNHGAERGTSLDHPFDLTEPVIICFTYH